MHACMVMDGWVDGWVDGCRWGVWVGGWLFVLYGEGCEGAAFSCQQRGEEGNGFGRKTSKLYDECVRDQDFWDRFFDPRVWFARIY